VCRKAHGFFFFDLRQFPHGWEKTYEMDFLSVRCYEMAFLFTLMAISPIVLIADAMSFVPRAARYAGIFLSE
jgi:hypothetical protein